MSGCDSIYCKHCEVKADIGFCVECLHNHEQALIKDSKQASREDTIKKCIEILENNQIFTATITNPIKIDEGNIKACAIDEIRKEFNYE